LKNWAEDENRFKKWMKLYKWKDSNSPIRRGQRAATLSHALEFWAEQMEVEKNVVKTCENVLEIRYEELLVNPEIILKKIWSFIGTEINAELLIEIQEMVDSSRAFAFRNDLTLNDFAKENVETLEKFGYSV
jgi:hypothetical protein